MPVSGNLHLLKSVHDDANDRSFSCEYSIWMSENEGFKIWLNNLTEMKNRGMRDILIACTDNLTGMSEAITAVFPKTEHQLCIVHQIRNSLKYVSYKHRKAVVANLKPIYQAVH